MLKSLFTCLLIFAGSCLAAHPLHVSVLNITIAEGRIAMTLKTFVDDWELAYFHYTGEEVDFRQPDERQAEWFGTYLNASLKLSSTGDSEAFRLETDSIWFDDMSMTIEMQAEYSGELNSLYIYNVLLIDIYPDQSNLTIVSRKKREKGIKFDFRKHDALLKFG